MGHLYHSYVRLRTRYLDQLVAAMNATVRMLNYVELRRQLTKNGFQTCHPERSEGPMHLASAVAAREYIGPSGC
jgi:hypothetical protein